VTEGDEEDGESHGVSQEERETLIDAMRKDEVAEGKAGGGQFAFFEDVMSVAGGQDSEDPPVASARNRNDTTPDVAMGDGEKTTVSSSSCKKRRDV
jgi:hypothetical protein